MKMKRGLLVVIVAGTFFSCKDKSTGKEFEVNGTITNNTGKFIYLEEVPVATMQRIVVDSFAVGKEGKYKLKTGATEASVYNLRLDESVYPLASVINDVPKITVDIKFSKENSQFAESYEVKGSEASKEMKDFMVAFNNNLQRLFYDDKQTDSLVKEKASDSLITVLKKERETITTQTKDIVLQFIHKSSNPALTMFETGYYQGTANNPGFKLPAIDNEEVSKIINETAAKFPKHQGVAAIKKSLDAQAQKAKGWVGQQAPDFTLPDASGKAISLSSFKGKYVLVDFWASWCGPCRRENPNVVNAWKKFKDKNFAILGVSLDRPGGKDDWMKAVMNDNLTWTQVSELKEWESGVVNLYGFGERGIPYNILVDPQGKVIAEALHGPELEEKLAEVLK